MVTGTSLAYVAGTQGRPIPLAHDGVRRTHTDPQPKRTGLDWDAITPTCKGCGTKSGQLATVDDRGDLCPTCRGVQPTKTKKTNPRGYASLELPEDELLRRFTGPDDTALGRELAELDATDPKVAAAAASLTDAADRLVRPDDHVRPEHLAADPEPTHEEKPAGHPARDTGGRGPAVPAATQLPQTTPAEGPEDHTPAYLRRLQQTRAQAQPPAPEPAPAPVIDELPPFSAEANLDAQVHHAARVLRDTANADHPATRLLRLNAIAALEALHLFHQLNPTQTPAPATPSPRTAGAGQTPTERNGRRSAEDRPAARTEGEAAARPATRTRRSRLDPHRDAIIRAYLDGTSPTQLGATYGVTDVTVRKYLAGQGIPLRSRSDAQKAHRRTTTTTGDTTP